jgi:hypothetical protein
VYGQHNELTQCGGDFFMELLERMLQEHHDVQELLDAQIWPF